MQHVNIDGKLAFEKAMEFSEHDAERHNLCQHVHHSDKVSCPFSRTINNCRQCKWYNIQRFALPMEICVLLELNGWSGTMKLIAAVFVRESHTWYIITESDDSACDITIFTDQANGTAMYIEEKLELCKQMMNLCKTLYMEYGIAHCDTSWENFLVVRKFDDSLDLKLIDFGMASFIGFQHVITVKGMDVDRTKHLDYLPPEAVSAILKGGTYDMLYAELFRISFVCLQLLMDNPVVRNVPINTVHDANFFFTEQMFGNVYQAVVKAHGRLENKCDEFGNKLNENSCTICCLWSGGMGARFSKDFFSFKSKDRNILMLVHGI